MFRRPGRGRLLLLVFLAASVVLITLDFRQGEGGPLETVRDVAASIVAPIQRGFTTVFRPVGDFFSSLGDIGELREDNSEMRQRLDELEGDALRADELITENQVLRKELGLDEHWSTMETLHAVITSRVPDNYKWAVTIDKGSDDGVLKDMAVINSDGLVGRIVEVDPNESTVLLLIDPEAAAAARIKESRDTGTVQGHGPNQDLSMDFVPGEARVEENDLVITSGFDDGIFPPGVTIGSVSEVSGESSDLQQDISVEPAVDFNALEFVTILMESGPNLRDPDEKMDKRDPKGEQPPASAQSGED